MKRIFLAVAVGLLFTANLSAKKQQPLTVSEGSVAVFKEAAATAVLITDYSETYVGEEGARTASMSDFLKERGEDYVNDWPKDVKSATTFFIHEFNKKNKRGLQFVEEEEGGDATYRVELKIETMDWGACGLDMVPFAGPKAGGYVIWGKLIVRKVEDGSVVTTITINNLKGFGGYTDTIRFSMLYRELSIELLKLKKK